MASSDSDEEVTFRYGTPLEPFEEDEIPSKRRAQDEQYVLDEHGRRRFHGAFTGGFSAGHGNTVDTPEGWTPATFKSSRGDRGTFKSAAPEDYMDEEDRSEFGIAPRQIRTQDDFVGRKRSFPAKRYHDGPIPGEPVLEQFLRVVPETAAMRLLKAMGWKPGGRIGRESPPAKTYGCYVPAEFRQNEDSSGEEDADYRTLFPEESCDAAAAKSDRFGLGYVPLSRHSVLGGMSGEYGKQPNVSHLKMKDKGKRVSIRGQAFGVGALEDEDEDVYAQHDMSQYDFDLGGPSGPEKEKPRKKSEGLEGFVKAKKPPPKPRSYPPPALPRDFTPAPAGFAATRFDSRTADSDGYTRRGLGRHELSSEDRGAFLGEPSIHPETPKDKSEQQTDKPEQQTDKPGKQTNKPEKQTEKPEDLIAKITGRSVNFVGEASDSNAETVNVDLTDNSTSFKRDSIVEYSVGERVFMPFASDPAKQERYEKFLRGETIDDAREGRLIEWEAVREKAEFEQAQKLYRPLTGVLKDRFTSGKGRDATAECSGGSDQMSAARSGMYGALTRTRGEKGWHILFLLWCCFQVMQWIKFPMS